MTQRRVFTLLAMLTGGIFLLSGAHAAMTITSSALDSILIQPNDRPTVVDIDTDQQFVATGYTADGVILSGLTFQWTTDGDVGVITSDGFFTGKKGGIGRVTARNGQMTASVGVVVRGVAKSTEPGPKKETLPSSSTIVQPINQNTNEPTDGNTDETEGPVLGETVEEVPATETPSTKPCTTIRAWIWIIVLFLYCVVLFAYFLSLGESRTIWWWVWPAVLTAAPAVLYFGTRCGSVHLWVPWTLGVLAVLLTIFYLRVLRPTNPQPVERP